MNLQLLTDLYEFSMANGYYATLPHDRQARFDVFYRRVPDNGSFVIVAGLQQVVEQVQNWHFTKENIEYLTSLNEFTPEFLDYLSKIKNHCSIKALPERTGGTDCLRKKIGRNTQSGGGTAGRYQAIQEMS